MYYLKWTKGDSPPYATNRKKYKLNGKWEPRIWGLLKKCERGYHFVGRQHVGAFWPESPNSRLWLVESKGREYTDGYKYWARRIRFVRELKFEAIDHGSAHIHGFKFGSDVEVSYTNMDGSPVTERIDF